MYLNLEPLCNYCCTSLKLWLLLIYRTTYYYNNNKIVVVHVPFLNQTNGLYVVTVLRVLEKKLQQNNIMIRYSV